MLLYELEDANIHKLKMRFAVISWQLYSSHILTSMNQWENTEEYILIICILCILIRDDRTIYAAMI